KLRRLTSGSIVLMIQWGLPTADNHPYQRLVRDKPMGLSQQRNANMPRPVEDDPFADVAAGTESRPIQPITPLQGAPKAAAPAPAATPAATAAPRDWKRRTSPRVAALRRQLRAKLLTSVDEADNWQRDDVEKQK